MAEASSFSSRDRRRVVVMTSVVAVAAVIGIAGWTLAPRDAASPARNGSRLAINVVAPIEPVPVEGSILETGTLNDGFDRAALDRRPEATTTDFMPPDAYVGEDWPPLEPVRTDRPTMPQNTPIAVATVTTTDPLADGSRLFGFDRRPVATPIEPTTQPVALRPEPAKNTEEFFE